MVRVESVWGMGWSLCGGWGGVCFWDRVESVHEVDRIDSVRWIGWSL